MAVDSALLRRIQIQHPLIFKATQFTPEDMDFINPPLGAVTRNGSHRFIYPSCFYLSLFDSNHCLIARPDPEVN
jgi:hypothetical protein